MFKNIFIYNVFIKYVTTVKEKTDQKKKKSIFNIKTNYTTTKSPIQMFIIESSDNRRKL